MVVLPPIIEFYNKSSRNPYSDRLINSSFTLWNLAMICTISSALIALQIQDWARFYFDTIYTPSRPHHRALVHSTLSRGLDFYKVREIAQMPLALLHASVGMSAVGFMIIFHVISQGAAITVDAADKEVSIAAIFAIGLFATIYIISSIIPCFDLSCPYRTPMTYVVWYVWNGVLLLLALGSRLVLGVFLLGRLQIWPDPSQNDLLNTPTGGAGIWTLANRLGLGQCLLHPLLSLYALCGKAIVSHWKRITDGIKKSIINKAISIQDGELEDIAAKIITWLFNTLALGDESKFQKFAASISRDDVPMVILTLDTRNILLREPLLRLLRCCTTGTSGPDEDVCKRALLICLEAILCYSKSADIPDLDFLWTNFANTTIMQALWNDRDASIRVTSRSICALLAKQVLSGPRPFEEPKICWLEDVTKSGLGSSGSICGVSIAFGNQININSYVYNVCSGQMGDLPIRDATTFHETIAVLRGN